MIQAHLNWALTGEWPYPIIEDGRPARHVDANTDNVVVSDDLSGYCTLTYTQT